ncbi:helix-turn-helix transcriptional regulator [Paracoccus lutimaris]|uniref:Regulatory LuxR family protein n=1 Tax=Paracoccus lutimaris TaxID=1490030 RepID=A0A368YGA6_9RHOB|nr:LuxR family transcriptional regulator [Paracoccus lutimaris]RCW79273.1 regulatory LuxR family protein [Paracoccus lutimaris]
MLHAIATILATRTVEGVWQFYVSQMAEWGFPHAAYHGVRLLSAANEQVADDSIFLSSYSPRLLHDLVSQNLFSSVPMYRWITQHKGSESWGWLQARRLAGRLTASELRAIDLFTRYGHVSGYAVSLADSVHRVRAGVIMSGAVGQRQDKLDEYWHLYQPQIEALTGLVHLRLASLPYTPPDEVLTARQREVLECISIGHTTQEIAEVLDVTPSTVEKHLRLARKALGARTTAQAVLLAASRRQMFVDPGEACTVASNQAATGSPATAPQQPWGFASIVETSDYMREHIPET